MVMRTRTVFRSVGGLMEFYLPLFPLELVKEAVQWDDHHPFSKPALTITVPYCHRNAKTLQNRSKDAED